MIITKGFGRHLYTCLFPQCYWMARAKSNPIQGIEQTKISNCTNFYRNSIRNVNIKTKTGRGTFTQHTLIKLMRIAESDDMQLLFQAFYNYMGHFTIFSNRTVDTFANKILFLANKNPQKHDFACQKLLELIKNHDYLRYYPSYKTTQCLANFFAERDRYIDFLRILNEKPLLKIDKDLYKQLMCLATQWNHFSILVKIGAKRTNWGIINNFDKHQLLSVIVDKLQKFDTVRQFETSNPYQNYLKSFSKEEHSPELAICWLLTKEGFTSSIEIVKQLSKSKQNSSLAKFVQVVRKLDQDSDEEFVERAQKQLEQTDLKSLFL